MLFGFPGENKIFKVINFCILIAKYYIYIQKLINSNKIDFYNYLVQLKQKLQIENIVCIDEGNPSKFEQFEFILDNIYKKNKIKNLTNICTNIVNYQR